MPLNSLKIELIKKTFREGKVFFNFDNYHDYTKDATEEIYTPDALLFAESENDIICAVNLCRKNDIPLIIRGAGTGYSGGALAVNGGLLVSIEKMNSIIIDSVKKIAIVGPGAITADIMNSAEENNLFYPPDPASYEESTISGNLAENAGGLRCKKYGVTKDYVLSFKGVSASGDSVEFNNQSPFGLLDVIIGSEGTLFIITEIKLRLIESPQPGKTIMATFDNAVDAASVVSEVSASGVVPCIMEYMDSGAIKCSNQYDPANTLDSCAAMLLFETDGLNADEEADIIKAICQKYSPIQLKQTSDKNEKETLWLTRRNLSKAVKQAYLVKISEDVCVPPSRLPELISFVQKLSKDYSIRINCYGHAGDGNLHVNFLGSGNSDKEDIETADGVTRLFKKTLELGGTLSGEHGIGTTKKQYLSDEFDSPTLNFMKSIKKALDKSGFLNPGKIFNYSL